MNIRPRPGELDQPSPDMGRTESDEESSFLTDAELQVDRLPQPYRTIDKIVIKIFNQTWEEIESREVERIERAKRQQSDCVYANGPIESLSECSSICFSPDSRYIFASMFSGELYVFISASNEFVCKLQADDMDPSCLDSMQCVSMKTGSYLLACIDDMGFAKLYIYGNSSIYLVQNLNPQLQGQPKSNAEKFTIESDGEFAGLASRMDDKCWVTFYKLPKDTWLSEITTATTTAAPTPKDKSHRPTSARSDQSMTTESSSKKRHDVAVSAVSFSPASIIHKVEEPSKVKGNHYTTYKEALDHATCSFGIGSGEAHLFTETHLKLRRAAMRKRHLEQMQHLDPDARPMVEYSPHWHFLRAAKLQPRSSPTQEGTVAALVWWSNTYDAHMYPLLLQRGTVNNREGQPGPEVVWPMCDLITSSAVSSCTLNVAFGMNNGTISVINRSECFPLTAVSVRVNVAINKINFLSGNDDTRLLASMADGGVSLVSCGTKTCKDLTPKLGHSDFELQLLCTLPPNDATKHFVCASSLDRLQVFNICGDAALCDLVFSDSLEEAQDRFWCCPDGSRIYAKNDDATVSSLQLDQLEVLRQVFHTSDTPPIVENSFKDRMQNLLLKRTAEQPVRTLAFRERWFEMARELQTAS